MKGADPYAAVNAAAEQVVREAQITSLPVDPFAIAQRADVVVHAKPMNVEGVSGMLVHANNAFGIVYATHIASVGFQRFSVAHELGHYYLPGHPEAVLNADGIHESRAGFVSRDRYEREADHFAAALLMPRMLFLPAMRHAGDGFAAIEKMAHTCQTSLSATAIRYASCSDEMFAVVVSTGPQIEYCVMSKPLKELPDLDWLRKSEPIPQSSATFAFNSDLAKVHGAQRDVGSGDLRDWFGGPRSIEVTEDVVGLGPYGKTLTVLYGFQAPDEEEEAEDEALVESWTPRFRR